MKKIALLLGIILHFSSLAQVGIGTKLPQESLHIEGTLIVEGVGDVDDSQALVGADGNGTLTTLNLSNKLTLKHNRLEFRRGVNYEIGNMDISGVTLDGNFVHNLDLKVGAGEVNEGKTVVVVTGTPSNIKLTGIQNGVNGLHLFFYHLDGSTIQFIDADDSDALPSSAENRIKVLAGSETISGNGCVEMIYDGVSQKWLFLSIHD